MTEQEPGTTILAREIAGLRKRDIPPDVAAYARCLFLDFCGNALAGAKTDSFRAAAAGLAHVPDGLHSVVGGGSVALPEYAALLNGVAGHSLETDDIQNQSSIHIGVVVLPTVLAASELSGASGKQALRAMIAGYEVTGRIGRAINPASHYGRGFHPTGTCGPYGAATAAAYLMGLSEEQTADALAIASVGSAGLLQFLNDGSLLKRLHPGWAAHSGFTAALLARAGYTGPTRIFEGRNGFLRAYSDASDATPLLKPWETLGGELLDTAMKPYATCRYNQSAMDGILQIVRDHNVTPENIEQISVDLMSVAWNIVADPIEEKRRPHSTVDAQFSLPFAAAVAALYRAGGVAEHTPRVIARAEVRDMMMRVVCVRAPELDASYPSKWPTRVHVSTRGGSTYSLMVDHAKGDPQNRLSWEETLAKFRSLTTALNQERCTSLIEAVEGIEALSSASTLSRLLSEASQA